jgi:NAD(P)-dependent dehydrogenase (short-subunit alcohol dehydrogenase family)
MSVSLNGKTALVTGSSRGIAQAIAEQLPPMARRLLSITLATNNRHERW